MLTACAFGRLFSQIFAASSFFKIFFPFISARAIASFILNLIAYWFMPVAFAPGWLIKIYILYMVIIHLMELASLTMLPFAKY